ncbi:leucyl/phenylalanyl-tRNA--protein transferase [Iamia sp.]|uniref:leucyl/phenylalanyl-tRNA--protein transferase n=1 Tax=Iamia sp. TaxID=2722710 RepID=UPI002CF0735C|nr:leucyl/phenylalanyl-tRNA--protein transferase [Iamia sp.]HXH59239.1 leucyl/phenylalanyl-tRNA--protein transferase [Iamia sp.]
MPPPLDPGPPQWAFPSPLDAEADGPVGIGADLDPATLLAAYRAGVFPMPVSRGRVLAWWSPDPRGVIPLDGLRVTRSLRTSVRRHATTVDGAFEAVLDACADPRRPGGWITRKIRRAYTELHRLGWAHSVETWTEDGRLAGGLYGVAIGGLFAGESMFHHERDGSKVAIVGLVDRLVDGGATVLDVQWTTPHLLSLGAVDLPRAEYLERLAVAVAQPQPEVFGRPSPAHPAAGVHHHR